MRRLTSLCNRLQRIGMCAIVVSHSRRDYVVFTARKGGSLNRSSFSSVRECELFLLTFIPEEEKHEA